MKKANLALAILLITVMAVSGFAQRGGGQGKGMPKYDPATETTIKGTVEEAKEHSCPTCGRNQTGLHLTVKSDAGTFDAHLGPTSFVTKNNFTFAKGDQVEIIGSKMKIDGADAVLAREVKKGGKTLTLRNAQGIPAWSGGSHRQ